MNSRFMRMILFFDLPRLDSKQRAAASRFAKDLVKQGFMMLQESVYCKLSLNPVSMALQKEQIKKIKPKEGSIMLLTVTEKQFASMDILLGEVSTRQITSTDRVIII